MIRHAAAVALIVCVSPGWLFAQGSTIIVSAASADVYKSPSTGSPTVGTVPRGTVLDVTRELGSWVKVTWPVAAEGVGYIHVSKGTIARGSAPHADVAGSTTARAATSASSSMSMSAAASLGQVRVEQPAAAPLRPVYVTPATHVLGVGGRMGGATLGGFGASARAWRHDRLGVQVEVSRYALTSSLTPGRLTSVQIEPSALYSLPDRVTDYFWLRPYVGSGATLRRQTLKSGAATAEELTDTGLGVQAFGGTELTFAGVPHFALSADLNYHWLRRPIAGFDVGGLGLSVAGHWYVK
jgi:hypothetical protein